MWDYIRNICGAGAVGVAVCMPMALSVAMPLALAGEAKAGDPVLVIAAPWQGGVAAVIRRAEGRIIGPASTRMAAFAVFEQPVSQNVLQSYGSWAVADAERLASLCGVSSNG